jgi:hypothetical protein
MIQKKFFGFIGRIKRQKFENKKNEILQPPIKAIYHFDEHVKRNKKVYQYDLLFSKREAVELFLDLRNTFRQRPPNCCLPTTISLSL